MYFSKLAVALFVTGLGTALAAPKGLDAVEVQTQSLEKRVQEDCWAALDEPPGKYWQVFINTPNNNHYDGCGSGHLDNLRGRCGVITNWYCNPIEPGVAIELHFLTSVFCTAFDITSALAAASNGHRVNCRDVQL